jgi:hypothetical protein
MERTTGIGHRVWALAGGHIPLRSTGPEPEQTSKEELCVLNAGDTDAQVEIRFYYGDRDPVGPYRLQVAASRMRQVRVNDRSHRSAGGAVGHAVRVRGERRRPGRRPALPP